MSGDADEGSLLGRLRSRRASAASLLNASPSSRAGETSFERFTAFETLPGMKDMLFQKAAAQKLGIASPYFRMQESAGGPICIMDGRVLVNFGTYNYLGLNGHPRVARAVEEALAAYGSSAGASRLVAGERPIHAALERRLAEVYGCEKALAFVSGFGTNVTVVASLTGARDLILSDALIHNSVLQGARLSGATHRSFAHNDIAALEDMLRHARHKYERVLIVVEGLYSMDGDLCDLPALIDLKKRYGCWLMVDEAHALGVLGKSGHGSREHHEIESGDVDIWMGTLSKTLAACGGYIVGSSALIEYLRYMAPGFVYSVGLSPLMAAAALGALDVLVDEPQRVAALRDNGRRFLETARAAGLDTGLSSGYGVVPVMVRNSIRACQVSEALLQAGINALPIIPPAVENSAARLRFFLSAEHTREQIDDAVRATARAVNGS